VHLNEKTVAPFPADQVINPTEPHFAIRCSTFTGMLSQLAAAGFHETGSETEPRLDRMPTAFGMILSRRNSSRLPPDHCRFVSHPCEANPGFLPQVWEDKSEV
jgi:hypothetical protein